MPITSTTYSVVQRDRAGGFDPVSGLPLVAALHTGVTEALSAPISINATYEGIEPRTTLLRSCSITATAPLSLALSITNYAHGVNPYKWASFRSAADPAYALEYTIVTGTESADSVSVTASEIVRFGVLASLVAKAQSHGSVSLAGGDDTYVATGLVDSSAFNFWQSPNVGYALTVHGARIDLGTGNDTFAATASFNGVLSGNCSAVSHSTVLLGDGNDKATLTASTATPVTGLEVFALQYSTLDAGAGNDDLIIGSARDARVMLGDGSDNLTRGGVNGWGRNIVDGGAGVDRLTLPDTTYTALDATRKATVNINYGSGGVFSRPGMTAEKAYFARSFDIQNGGLGSVAPVSASFAWNGSTFTNFEQIAVAGGIFDTATRNFVA